jgi:hypothetical protein
LPATDDSQRGVDMLWTGVVMSVVVVGAMMAAVLRRRPVDADGLGTVSERWLARHRAQSR